MALFVLAAVCTVVATYILHTGADQTTAGTLLVYGPRRFVPVVWLMSAVLMSVLGWRWVVASLGMAAFSLLAFSSFSLPSSGGLVSTANATSEARTLRIVSFNVDYADDLDILFGLAVPRWSADVIVFQACGDPAASILERSTGADYKGIKVGEFCIASKHPLVGGKLIPLNPPRFAGKPAYAVHVRVQMGGDTVSVVAVHLASPRRELSAALKMDFTKLENSIIARMQQADKLSRYLQGINEPLVIAGDFNTLEESQIYQRYFASYTNAFRATSSGFGHTMQAGIHRLRIDHVLTGAGMQPVALDTEWDWPTEHRPVVATLRF